MNNSLLEMPADRALSAASVSSSTAPAATAFVGVLHRLLELPGVALFSAAALVAMPSIAQAGDTLGDRRLFFTASQREQAQISSTEQTKVDNGDTESINQHSSASRQTGEPEATGQENSEAAVSMQLPESAGEPWLYFNALVLGSRGMQVMVNGFPCRYIPHARDRSTTSRLAVDCPAGHLQSREVLLFIQEGRLLVEDGQGVVQALEPGAGL